MTDISLNSLKHWKEILSVDTSFPWGTFLVNIIGSLLIGFKAEN